VFSDIEKAKQVGMNAYIEEQKERIEILSELLNGYNDGRRKSFFCLAVNLLELQDIKDAMEKINTAVATETPLKEKAKAAVAAFMQIAAQKGVSLKKRK